MPRDYELNFPDTLESVSPELRHVFKAAFSASLSEGNSAIVSYAKAYAAIDKASGAQPLYAKRPLLNAEELIDWAKSVGFETTLLPDDLHVTVMASRRPVIVDPERYEWKLYDAVQAKGGARWLLPLGERAVGLVFDSPEIVRDWLLFREEYGASWDFPSFIPHVTLTYNGEGVDLESITPFSGDLNFGPVNIKPFDFDAEMNHVEKRAVNDDLFTFRSEASARSVDLGMGGRVHVTIVDGQKFWRPGSDEEEYLFSETEEDGSAFMSTLSSLAESIKTVSAMLSRSVDIGKSDDKQKPSLLFDGKVEKMDPEQRIVWGWASVSKVHGQLVTDQEGDIITPDEMMKAANLFMQEARAAKVQHEGKDVGVVLHSIPLTKEIQDAFGIHSDVEGWAIGMKVFDDEHWESAKAGNFTGFSIGGEGKRYEFA